MIHIFIDIGGSCSISNIRDLFFVLVHEDIKSNMSNARFVFGLDFLSHAICALVDAHISSFVFKVV